MELNSFAKFFHPRILKKYFEVFPLIGAVGFGAAICVTTMAFELYSRPDAKWDRWSKDPQYMKFLSGERRTKYYWHAKPEDTAPEIIKILRRDLASPRAIEDK